MLLLTMKVGEIGHGQHLRTAARRTPNNAASSRSSSHSGPSGQVFDLAHGQSPGWQADPPFRGEAACHCVVERYYVPVEIIPAKPNTDFGIGRRLFGFMP
jgi:hypothetical protein